MQVHRQRQHGSRARAVEKVALCTRSWGQDLVQHGTAKGNNQSAEARGSKLQCKTDVQRTWPVLLRVCAGLLQSMPELPQSSAKDGVRAGVLGSAVLEWPSQCSHREFVLLRSSLVVEGSVGLVSESLTGAHLLDAVCGATDCRPTGRQITS